MHPQFTLGFDLGGTHLKAALVDAAGGIGRFVRLPSRAEESAGGPLEAVAEAAVALAAPAGIIGVALGSPGAVDPDLGVLVGETPHLPHWRDFPLAEALRGRLGRPVAVDNDANLAALAEHRVGAARGSRVSLTVTIGTGIGCGIVVEGRVLRGARGGAGEIGHLPLGRSGMPCRCGVTDCVEPEASGLGLAHHARVAGLEGGDAAAVFAAAARGDRDSGLVIARLADRLGAAIASAVNLLNPDVVVIGGGVGGAGEALLEPLGRALERYALASHRRGLRLLPAALGDRAGVVGAGLFAWERFAPGA